MTAKGKPWTDREVRYLRRHYGKMPTREIATALGRTLIAVKNFVHLHDIGSNVGRNWTPQDDAFLRSYYGVMSSKDIASKLRRTSDAVRLRASHMGIAAELRTGVDDRTAETWAKVLGVMHGTVNNWVRRGMLNLDEEYDEPYLRTRVISDDTMEMWLRQGGALRCKPHADTPQYWARLIAEVKAQYVSATELRDIDPFFYPAHMRRKQGMGAVKATSILCGSKHGHDSYYKKTEIYDAIYCVGHLVPRHVKDPYIKAIVMAWDSVYVATWQLLEYYRPKMSMGHPPHIIQGVYNRAEVVAWLRTRKDMAKYAHALRQDPICYRELHRDLDRKAQRGGAR